jgi:ABC-type transport system involved in multi-copper enzyme maturation permease subunit
MALQQLLSFEYSLNGTTSGGINAINARPSVLSRELFQVLSILQIAGWMILAPALTAAGLAGERERGLLEAVQLSRMTPFSILFGKMMSALSFIALMMPVALPIIATSFLMGGVSPQEIVLTALLQFVTAATGASLGLYFSARSRRAPGALATAFIFVGVWGMGSYTAFNEWQNNAPLFGPQSNWPGLLWGFVTGVIGWTNPIVAALDLIDPISPQRMWAKPFGWIFKTVPLWAVNIGLQLGLSALLLWMATRALASRYPMSR